MNGKTKITGVFSNLTSTADKVIDEGTTIIRPATLVQLQELSFKLVPLSLGTLIYEDKYPDRRITKAFGDFYPNSQLMLKDDQITDSVLKLVEYYSLF